MAQSTILDTPGGLVKPSSQKPETPIELEGYLSPSRINTFLACPRKFYYRYISKIPEEDTFYTIRGRIVHKVCEDIFDRDPSPSSSYPEVLRSLRKRAHDIFEREWAKADMDNAFGTDRHTETSAMVDRFLLHLKWRMDAIYGKYQDPIKAWRFTKPRFTELHLVDHKLKCHGYVDAVIDLGEDGLILVDYKTSNVFKFPLNNEYQRQLYIYAVLYERCEGKLPAHVALEYLLTGQTTCLPVRREFCDDSIELIKDVHAETQSYAISDYPQNTAYKFCSYCDHRKICLGQ